MNDVKRLVERDYERCACEIGVSVPTIKAVCGVESGKNGGFLASGKPVILYEGHVMWRRLEAHGINPQLYVHGNEDILYSKWTKQYYLGGEGEYLRLHRAMAIDNESALEAASWGMFQIMGFNYAECGCKSVREFVEKVGESESVQLDLWCRFIQAQGLDKYLQNRNWREFARRYNGVGYARNEYDKRLEREYNKFNSRKV